MRVAAPRDVLLRSRKNLTSAPFTLAMLYSKSPFYRLIASLPFVWIAVANLSAQVVRVPADQPNFASAVSAVQDGGVIEFAGGTYQSPAGGFSIYDLREPKGFTVRAASGAAVVFTGGGATDILRISPSDPSKLKQINFEFITFANGVTYDAFLGGGMTLVNAKLVFKFCTFQNNSAASTATGGGAQWIAGSVVSFEGCIWSDNSSPNFGGGMSISGSRVFIRNCRFNGNRVDVPNHKPNSAGGAIYIADATVRISNCAFDNNRAGYVGGAIDTNGSWNNPLSTPSVDLVIRDSTFTGNRAQFDPSVPFHAPAVGGAAHFEGQTTARIYNCRFINNTARQGGAVSNYLAITEFTGCVFQGNQATGVGSEGGQGGAIIALSSENPGINHRSMQLIMTDCLIRGSGSSVKSARQGGAIYAGGDMNFAYGLNGSAKNGTEQSNRGTVNLNRVALFETAAIGDAGLPGTGGAILGTFIDLTMTESIVANCFANASGAGVQLIDGSVGNITRSTIAGCVSDEQGTAITLYGASLNMSDSNILNNTINGTARGVAITSAPNPAFGSIPDFEINGVIQNCLFSGNSGQSTIYEGDRDLPPFNRMQFNGNTFFPTGMAFYNDIIGPPKTVAELNSLEIRHLDGTVVDKSTSPNIQGAFQESVGSILMIPPTILTSGAPGEALPIPAYVVYAASAPPTVDGVAQRSFTGVVPVSHDGVHSLVVGSNTYLTSPPKAVALNIATRLPVGDGQDVLIGGFIIQGSAPKRLAIRAVGPSLNGIVSGALQDPRLELRDGTGATLASNDNWRITNVGGAIDSDQSIDLEATGVAPSNNAESAMVVTLNPGAYTAIISGVNNTTGIAIVEIYDLDAAFPSTLANISTRGFVQAGDNVMIGGFIYLGGGGATQVVLRAIGPSLAAFGITNPLIDPMLELRDGNGAVVASNDDWKNSPDAATVQRLGFQLSNDAESALYQTGLARGAYTAIVRGKNGGIGVGVVEVYVF
jgi:hypothetical protein